LSDASAKSALSERIERQLTQGYIFKGCPELHPDMRALIEEVKALEAPLAEERTNLAKAIEDEYEKSPLRYPNLTRDPQLVGHNQGFDLALEWIYEKVTGHSIDKTRREAFLKSEINAQKSADVKP
jgi:hypothetical protein